MKRLRTKNRPKARARRIFPAPLAFVLGLVAVLSVTYLWLCGRCDQLGQEIKRKERALVELRRHVVNEEYKWSNLTSPQNMQRLLQAHQLVMTWPSERDVVRLGAPMETPSPAQPLLAQARRRGRND
jgi:hypothetical protein